MERGVKRIDLGNDAAPDIADLPASFRDALVQRSGEHALFRIIVNDVLAALHHLYNLHAQFREPRLDFRIDEREGARGIMSGMGTPIRS